MNRPFVGRSSSVAEVKGDIECSDDIGNDRSSCFDFENPGSSDTVFHTDFGIGFRFSEPDESRIDVGTGRVDEEEV